jgi:hypothetical protein
LEYFRWKDECPNKKTTDQRNRNVRRITGQSIIGAQGPLGEPGQMLRTEITRLNGTTDMQILSTRSIGVEVNNNSREGTATGESAPRARAVSAQLGLHPIIMLLCNA